jgi:hypothetical protein
MTVPQGRSLLRIAHNGSMTYYSVKKHRWVLDTSEISLEEVCGLEPEDRDRLLAYLQRTLLRKVPVGDLATAWSDRLS